jgi:hypothetical protein
MSPRMGRFRSFFAGLKPNPADPNTGNAPSFATFRAKVSRFARGLARRTVRSRDPRGRTPVRGWWRRRLAALFAAGFPTNKSGNNASTR